jgi:hypothetical protein
MSATINKQLNDIFEDVYHLFNDSIMVPEYLKKPEIERCVFEFMEKINIQSEWNMTDEEREELNGKYFEAGHNDVDAVFYPFNAEEKPNPIKIQNTINVWENALISIQSYCKDKELVEKANALEERIDNLKYY